MVEEFGLSHQQYNRQPKLKKEEEKVTQTDKQTEQSDEHSTTILDLT